MEFPFNLSSLLGAPSGHDEPFVGRIEQAMLAGRAGDQILAVLDVMGKRSAVAQGLRKPVTTGTPALLGQRIYLLVQGRTALGLLKVGTKQLFVAPPVVALRRASGNTSSVQDALRQISPVCALDFYVHESCQRSGLGFRLFEAMLREEALRPHHLAYDRPSPKLIGFLRKHYSLCSFQPQNNNFVVFDEYFLGEQSPPSQAATQGGARGALSSKPAPQLFDDNPRRRGQGSQPSRCSPRTAGPPFPSGAHADRLPPQLPSSQTMPWMHNGSGSDNHGRGPHYQNGHADAMHGSYADPGGRNPCGSSARSRSTSSTSAAGRGSSSEYHAALSMPAAGMPSGGLARSGSIPNAALRHQESELLAATSAKRYASPLHHAGHRMVAQ
mmetsp:Transcript_2584/g.6601  ORF Transcript_2584/g.6601 Transcript_2584/m.6601 type:complete len:384 (+) Transcript_2584:66-1217(+)